MFDPDACTDLIEELRRSARNRGFRRCHNGNQDK
jgi:hypothetical protein